jgi:hypothetical protein
MILMGRLSYLSKSLSQCHFVQYKFHKECPGITCLILCI